jgi:hypothetical protein
MLMGYLRRTMDGGWKGEGDEGRKERRGEGKKR